MKPLPPSHWLALALQRPLWLGLALLLLLPLAVQLGRTQAMPALGSSWVWPPSGLALAYLWIYGRQYWPFVLGGLALSLLSDKLSHPLLYIVNPLVGTLAPWLAVRLMGTLQEQSRTSLARTLWALLLWGVLLSTLVHSGLSALILMLLEAQPPDLWRLRLPSGAASSALGVLLIMVPVMGWLMRLESGRSDEPERQHVHGAAYALPWMLLPLALEAVRLSQLPSSLWALPALAAGALLQLAYSWRFGGGWGSLLVLAQAVLTGGLFATQLPLAALLPQALQTWTFLAWLGLLNLAVMVVQAHWGTRLKLLQQGLRGGGVVAWAWQPQSDHFSGYGDWGQLTRLQGAPPSLQGLTDEVHEDDRAGFIATHHRRLQTDHTEPYEFRVRGPDGRWRWLRETGQVVRRDAQGQPLHLAGLLQDISASHEAREALALSEQRYRTLSGVAPVGVFQSLPDGRCTYVNAEYAAMLGTSPERCLDFGWTEHLVGVNVDEAVAGWRLTTAAGERFEGEARMRRRDGSEIWVVARAQPVRDAQQQVLSYVGSLTDISEHKAQQELIWKQAHVDALSGLPNRRLFMDRLDQAMQRATRQGNGLALLYLDLDKFKEVNDTLGHAVGDQLLVAAAQRISASVRASDTTARLGGDEFTVIVTDVQGRASVDNVAAKLVQALAAPFVLGQDTVYVGASIGITLFPDDGCSVLDLMKHADQALYQAKAEGRNRYGYFTPAMQAQAQLSKALTQDLRAALGSAQLSLHYQPIVALASRRLVKAEALLRWQHPQRGAISPAQFVPLAEESGLIHPLGDWVFEQALLMVQAWRATHGELLPINVNKSPRSSWPATASSAGLRSCSRPACRLRPSASRSPRACCSTTAPTLPAACVRWRRPACPLRSTTLAPAIRPWAT